MASLQRLVFRSSVSFVAASTLWQIAGVLLAVAGLIMARACGYELDTVAAYLAYLTLHILVPGAVAMYLVNRAALSFATLFALAIPTGFAVEIFTFLGLSALGLKTAYAWTPLIWVTAVLVLRWRQGEWPLRVRLAGNHAGVIACLVAVFLWTMVLAASQMFSESPLADGMPTRAIFHDWVYLVSRAAVIKNNWPLDDPSLSGTPLQYHYFMMVHAAAVSWTTDIEITTVMLRLIFGPLGAALVAQAYLLGRAVSRTPWGGVAAALLAVGVSEASFASSYGEPMFLGLFGRLLFVSPTFFFGMIFCGALLLAVAHCARRAHCEARHYAWLVLLGTAGTGAKGTVLPVVIGALGLWTLWQWRRQRLLPVRLVGFGLALTAAFAAVYIPTMSSWHTGDAAFRPFHVFHLSQFWKEYLGPWTAGLREWLPADAASAVASLACAAVVFAGTCGVRLLALPYLFWGDVEKRDPLLVGWLGSFFAASAGMGMLMELNSHGELYVFLMMRLPMAALAAAFFAGAFRRITVWWRESRTAPSAGSRSPFAVRAAPGGGETVDAGWAAHWVPRVLVVGGALVLGFVLVVQASLAWKRSHAGFGEWMKTPTDLKPDPYMRDLQEGLLWVRGNTERNAVIVANAFTPENMKKDHWGALDRTLMGVHFYYSALSERRLWFEGPNYLLDTTRARLRASMASGFFYRGWALPPAVVTDGPCYVLVDRTLADGAEPRLPLANRLYANSRLEVYRFSEFAGDGFQ